MKILESNSLTLLESLSIVRDSYNKIKTSNGIGAKVALNKFKAVLFTNPGLEKITKICAKISGKSHVVLQQNLSEDQLAHFRYCPITNVNLERSFSKYRLILSDRRLNFSEFNLKCHMIINFNKNL